MDALALLCNLHADGPDSLLQLREAGCDRLELLAALDIDELAGILDSTPAASERFLAEARLLAERLTGTPLELLDADAPEASAAMEPPVPVDAPPPDPGEGAYEAATREEPERLPLVSRDALDEVADAFDEGDPEADLEFPRPGGASRPASEPLADAVLQAWRELDAEVPVEVPAEVPLEVPVETERDAVIVPQPPPRSAEPLPIPLADADVEGLSEQERRQLIDAGLTTLEELLEGDAVELAQRSAVPFTRLLRVQFLARRAGAPEAPPRAAPQPEARWREPTGGPFA